MPPSAPHRNPTHSLATPPEVGDELAFMARVANERIPRAYSTAAGKRILCVPPARAVLVIDEHRDALAALLRGLIVTKNAALIGKASNVALRAQVYALSHSPAAVLPHIDFDTPYQMLTWRKGIRYRFIDLARMTMLDWAMPGGETYLRREIEVRSRYADVLPMSPLVAGAQDGTYFCQELLAGSSLLARSLAPEHLVDILQQMLDSLGELYRRTQQTVDTREYIDALTDQLNSANAVPQEVLANTNAVAESIRNPPPRIVVAQVHGDLNLGNILLEDEHQTPYLIDWEESDLFSLLHDFYNLDLFVSSIHKHDGIKPDLFLRRPPFSEFIDANESGVLDCYKKLFYLERIFKCLRYPARDDKWLLMLNNIMMTKCT